MSESFPENVSSGAIPVPEWARDAVDGLERVDTDDVLSLFGLAGVLSARIDEMDVLEGLTDKAPGAESLDGYKRLQARSGLLALQHRVEVALGGTAPTATDVAYGLPELPDFSKPYSPFA